MVGWKEGMRGGLRGEEWEARDIGGKVCCLGGLNRAIGGIVSSVRSTHAT